MSSSPEELHRARFDVFLKTYETVIRALADMQPFVKPEVHTAVARHLAERLNAVMMELFEHPES